MGRAICTIDLISAQNRPAMNEYKCTKAKEKSHYIEDAQGAIFMVQNLRFGDWWNVLFIMTLLKSIAKVLLSRVYTVAATVAQLGDDLIGVQISFSLSIDL